jgi:hypothetical protein
VRQTSKDREQEAFARGFEVAAHISVDAPRENAQVLISKIESGALLSDGDQGLLPRLVAITATAEKDPRTSWS